MADSDKINRVGIVLASRAELDFMRPATDLLTRFQVPYELILASVWAAPERLLSWAERAGQQGIRVILASAANEPQLAGFIAAATRLPVIAVPAHEEDGGAHILYHALETSAAAPVASVAPGGAEQAALLAVRILATADPEWAQAIEGYRQSLVEDLQSQQDLLVLDAPEPAPDWQGPVTNRFAPLAPKPQPQPASASRPRETPAPEEPPVQYVESDEGPVEIRPANFDRPLTGEPVKQRLREETLPPASTASEARKLGRRRIDADAPEYGLIEEAVDCLLEGGIIALPTDTVYGLAADATNPAAVEKLYELKGRPHNKSIVLFVDSPKLLSGIACNLTIETRRLMEAFWPGPLTVIFQKRGSNFMHVSNKETIGVRLPDHSVPLSIMQALARPLACTSANLAGRPEALSADEVEETFGDDINLILDGGMLLNSPPSTVIDVTGDPFRILRLGSVSYDQIAAIVGEKMEPES